MKEINEIYNYLESKLKKIKNKVFCICGRKLIKDRNHKNLVCPLFKKYEKTVINFSLLKKDHNINTWGTKRDLYEYELLKEILDFIEEVK